MDGHLWAKSKVWDPEGLLTTLPAVASQIAGLLAGHWLATRHSAAERTVGFFLAGLGLLWAGQVLDAWNMPINKNLWTPAYVAATAGWACLLFGASFWLLDAAPDEALRQRARRLAQPLVVFGMNALALFVLSGLVAKLLYTVKVGDLSLKAALYAPLANSGLAPVNASLLFAVLFVAVFYGLGLFLFKRQWFIKV